MPEMQKHFCLLFLFSFATLCLFAQTDSIPDQELREIKVETSAKPSISKTLLQSYSDKEIDKIGIQSVSDAVRRFAGVSVKDYGGIGGLKTVSIRGLGAQHTAVSYDGITVGEAQSGQVDIGRFSLDNVSLLSLVIGQSNDIFQSARNLSSVGVLNINTLSPEFINKNHEGKLSVKTGSFGLFNPSFSYLQKINDSWATSVSAGWQRADGTYKFKFDNGQFKEKRKRYNSDVDIWRTELNIYGNLKKAGSLKLKAYYYDSERGLPAPLISVNEHTGERLWDKDFFTQGNYENKLNKKFSIRGLAKFSRNYSKYENKNINYGDNGKQADKYTQFEYYVSGSLLYKPIDVLSFSLSQDYFHNKLGMDFETLNDNEIISLSSRSANRNSWLTAINGQFETKRITATGSLLYSNVSGQQSEGVNPDDLSRFSPSFSISYKPFDFNLRIRTSYKDIFRVPSFNDIYYTRVGSRSLKPEKTKQYNLGAVWMHGSNSFFDFLSISVDGYINKVTDKIVIFNSGAYYWSMINMGKVTIKGIDVTLNLSSSLSKDLTLSINGTYSYQDAKDDDTKGRPSYTPKHTGNLAVTLENPWLNLTYSFVASSERYSKPLTMSTYLIDSFFDHNISVNKTLQCNDTYKLRLQGELLNIGNKNYQIVQSYPMPGRSFRLAATLIF